MTGDEKEHGRDTDEGDGGLVVEAEILPIAEDPDGQLRDRQFAAIVRLLRRASADHAAVGDR